MAFKVTCTNGVVRVDLSGWDRLVTWRRALTIDLDAVGAAFMEDRGVLEAAIDHRVSGFGAHNGARWPGRRRIGTMLGRAVEGRRQFWAVSSGSSTDRLLVLNLESGPFVRLVLEVDADIEACVIAAVPAR